ncbi:GNAT family N-acetyltransferase [Pseudomonadales bacterium]|nr:GNAT family N-acetyltransferase [Pseudomonadales bacterium]MDA8953486.1 GNAT family N-acetyltransferase [Pseudomonadales bacterium]MDB2594769.1 GNAT family N-acetyltransferase [Pseudomonadales bacterium]
MALGFRDIEVFSADPKDLPADLSAIYAQTVAAGTAEILRVAKLNEVIIACYAMHGPLIEEGERGTDYVLQMVAVQEQYRHQNVGRWLMGHAIGVAESKGGRGLQVPHTAHQDFFLTLGFTADATIGGFRFQMIQE